VLPTSVEELVGGRRKRLAGPAAIAPRGPPGYWVYARVAPDRRTLLAQWSGECESPAAFMIDGNRRLRRVGAASRHEGPESRALGWSPSGRAVVDFPAGTCGAGYRGGAGVFSLGFDSASRLIIGTKTRQQIAFWG
jgi:hypothetical protein